MNGVAPGTYVLCSRKLLSSPSSPPSSNLGFRANEKNLHKLPVAVQLGKCVRLFLHLMKNSEEIEKWGLEQKKPLLLLKSKERNVIISVC